MARPSQSNPPSALLPTDVNINTGRFDLMQELSVPFSLGPVKLAPYGMLDLTEYTQDLNGDSVGRVWGGGGARASLPFSRLYEGAPSELFNVRGLYHKVVLGANYLYAKSNVPVHPAADARPAQRRRDRPGVAEHHSVRSRSTSPGPTACSCRRPATRRASSTRSSTRSAGWCTNKPDTLDNINVLQLDLRQRFQTKRGYPGLEHTVDLVTLGTSVSYFPEVEPRQLRPPVRVPGIRLPLERRRPHRAALDRLVRAVRQRLAVLHRRELTSTARTARRSTSATGRSTRSTAAR